jgi:hypothetical protein
MNPNPAGSLLDRVAELEAETARLRAERESLVDIIEEIYSQYDGGIQCHEYDEGEPGAYIGVAILISDESEGAIISLLNAERPAPPPIIHAGRPR